LIFFISVP